MLPFGRKTALLLAKRSCKQKGTLRWATSSPFIKLPSIWGAKKDSRESSADQEKVSQQATPGKKEYFVPRKFVPMTRRALIRRIVEDEVLLNASDRHYFHGLAEIMDKSIAGSFHTSLEELKVTSVIDHNNIKIQ